VEVDGLIVVEVVVGPQGGLEEVVVEEVEVEEAEGDNFLQKVLDFLLSSLYNTNITFINNLGDCYG